jgi:sulfofructose kinase
LRDRKVDVVGLGLNATDTILLVSEFPPLGGKEKVAAVSHQAGGQVATALVCCQRLGLRARYIGKVGGDQGGKLQLKSLRKEGVDVQFVKITPRAPNQIGLIIVDQATGERTVFWDRDPRLALRPSELVPAAIRAGRILLIDGCDVEGCLFAAGLAKQSGIPVVADFDTVYEGVEKLLPFTNYLIASHNFLPAVAGDTDPFRALQYVAREYRVPVLGMTLGRHGALVYANGSFHYSPGFVVETVDTTGAGDVFHGAFIYGILRKWALPRTLEFANAMAALNCTALGARARIATAATAQKLIPTGARHRDARYEKTARRRFRPAAVAKPHAAGRSR